MSELTENLSNKNNESMDTLTEEQKLLLMQSIELVKNKVHDDVFKRFYYYLLFFITLITFFGFLSLNNIKQTITNSIVAKLLEDPSLKQSILEETNSKLNRADILIAEINQLYEKSKQEQLLKIAEANAEVNKAKYYLNSKTKEENLLFEQSIKDLNNMVIKLKKILEENEATN